MNQPNEAKRRAHPVTLIGFGWLLFVLGLPCWALASSALQVFAPYADWPKMAGMIAVPVPLLFVAAWKYDSEYTGEIGPLLVGWCVGVGMARLAYLIGGLAPHG